jgi:putative cell wall-binding protein
MAGKDQPSRTAAVAVLASMAMLMGLLAAPAAADDGLARSLENLARMPAASTLTTSDFSQQQQSGNQCFGDPAGDVQRVDVDPPAAGTEPRADIIQHCVAYTSVGLNLSVRAVQPSDPETDANWRNGTFVGWFIDTDGDGDGNFFVDFSLQPDGVLTTARVVDIQGTEPGGVERCTAQARADGGSFQVAGITTACIGQPPTLSTSPSIVYDHGVGQATFQDAAPFPAPTPIDAPRETARLAGPGRIDTAVEISKRQFPQGAGRVFLARADLFADAVAGGSLTGGPILLVPSAGTLPAVVAAEIARLSPTDVTALGGTAAISEAMLAQAGAGRQTGRLAGPGRIQTAVEISKFQFPQGAPAGDVYLARADLFADAVAGGQLTRGPILLIPSCGAPPAEVQAEIARVNPSRVVALGGAAAICPDIHTTLAAGRSPARLSGPGRIDTAVAISMDEWPNGATEVFLARADIFADAVAAGSLTDGAVLLVPSCGAVPAVVVAEIQRVNPARVTALGGNAAVCDALLTAAAGVTPTGGG